MDLLIIDIDDMFIYHRTVLSANNIFSKYFSLLFKKRPISFPKTKYLIRWCIATNPFKIDPKYLKKTLFLAITGVNLYINYIRRKFLLSLGYEISNHYLISIWKKTVKRLGEETKDYILPKKHIIRYLNKKMARYLELVRGKSKILAITQNFSMKDDLIKDILNIDYLESNELVVNEGRITDIKINVKDREDKKKIADRYIKKLRPETIGIFIDDHDDLELLKIKRIKLIVASKRLKRFIDKNTFSMKKGPDSTIICEGG